MIKVVLLIVSFLNITNVFAQDILVKELNYKDGKVELAGHLVHKSDLNLANAPVIVVVHNWMGISDETLTKAKDMAKLDYAVVVADIYGKGVRPTNPKDAGATAGLYKSDLPLFRKRVELAVKEAKKLKSKNIFVAGYCFGGTAAIEYARTGAKDIRGAISFHGGLYANSDDKKIKAPLLVLHGAIDPAVTKVDLDAMLKSFDDNKVDYDFISYSGAVHSFTDTTKVGNAANATSAYNKKADMRSWIAFTSFVKELSK